MCKGYMFSHIRAFVCGTFARGAASEPAWARKESSMLLKGCPSLSYCSSFHQERKTEIAVCQCTPAEGTSVKRQKKAALWGTATQQVLLTEGF